MTTRPTPEEGTDLRPPAPSRRHAVLHGRAFGSSLTVLAFLVVFAIYSVWLGDRFLDLGARLLNIHQNVPVLLIGLAAMVTLVAGKFDLSVSSTASLTAFLAVGLRTEQGMPFWLVLLLCAVVGLVVGLVNGILVEYLSINAFIATLGTGGVVLGLSSVYSGGGALIPARGEFDLPEWFGAMGSFTSRPPTVLVVLVGLLAGAAVVHTLAGMRPRRVPPRVWTAVRGVGGLAVTALLVVALLAAASGDGVSGGLSWLVVLLVGVASVLWLLLELTTFGRGLKATGANPEAARLAGIGTRRHVVGAFMIGGLLSALAGVALAATQGTVAPDIAGAFLLPAFAAAFLSTVVFSSGPFTVWGTVAGGIFVVWVGQGLITGGLPATWTDVVNGAVLLVAVALSTVVRMARR
ncbi:ABC transporter permease [Pseudonocardia pini]|uniref:ABC transporter permease n=1 Tax=Pseudonocardia pini TaxID=2758030 RepID=UPI0015F0DA94|nr:ABC transporter permease [Pseudonocardia pini]